MSAPDRAKVLAATRLLAEAAGLRISAADPPSDKALAMTMLTIALRTAQAMDEPRAVSIELMRGLINQIQRSCRTPEQYAALMAEVGITAVVVRPEAAS